MGDLSAAWRGLRWVWLASFCSQLVGADLSADIQALSEITISRVQQFPELSVTIRGLEFIPEQLPSARFGALDQALERFQRVLPRLLGRGPAAQVANDVENLRSLLRRLAAHRGCALGPPAAAAADQEDRGALQARLDDSAFTVVSVTFHRLRQLLRFIKGHVDEIWSC